MQHTDVICVGETMALVTPVEPVPLATADLFRIECGGAESNVAIQLRQLGLETMWFSRLGADPLGERVLTAVGSHGVDTSLVITDPSAPTGLYLKDPGLGGTRVHYYRKGSAASRMSPADLGVLPLSAARLVHVSGITPGLSPSCRSMLDRLFELTAATEALLSFDVNYRPGVWSVEDAAPVLLDFARRADVVLVGRDEAEVLWGTSTAEAVRDLLPGTRRLVVKDADVGATEFIPGQETIFVPARRVEVVESVGAGDAFAAGYLAALLAGAPAAERLARGHEQAASALSSTADFVPAGTGLLPGGEAAVMETGA